MRLAMILDDDIDQSTARKSVQEIMDSHAANHTINRYSKKLRARLWTTYDINKAIEFLAYWNSRRAHGGHIPEFNAKEISMLEGAVESVKSIIKSEKAFKK